MKVTVYVLESGTRFIKVIEAGSKVILEMYSGSPKNPSQAILFNRREVGATLAAEYVRAWQLVEYKGA